MKTMKATQNQMKYLTALAEEAGYTGDRVYNAARDLLGVYEARFWKKDKDIASELIDALKESIGNAPTGDSRERDSVSNNNPESIVHREPNGTTWVEY